MHSRRHIHMCIWYAYCHVSFIMCIQYTYVYIYIYICIYICTLSTVYIKGSMGMSIDIYIYIYIYIYVLQACIATLQAVNMYSCFWLCILCTYNICTPTRQVATASYPCSSEIQSEWNGSCNPSTIGTCCSRHYDTLSII